MILVEEKYHRENNILFFSASKIRRWLNFAQFCISCVSTCNLIYANRQRAVRTSNNNELLPAWQSYSERLSSRDSSWDEEHAPLRRSFRPNDGYPGEMTNNTLIRTPSVHIRGTYLMLNVRALV